MIIRANKFFEMIFMILPYLALVCTIVVPLLIIVLGALIQEGSTLNGIKLIDIVYTSFWIGIVVTFFWIVLLIFTVFKDDKDVRIHKQTSEKDTKDKLVKLGYFKIKHKIISDINEFLPEDYELYYGHGLTMIPAIKKGLIIERCLLNKIEYYDVEQLIKCYKSGIKS